MSPFMTISESSPPKKARRLAPRVSIRLGSAWGAPSALTALTEKVVPTSAPDYTRNCPLGNQIGSIEYALTSRVGVPPPTGILNRFGSPSRLAATASHRPSGDQA